MDHRDNPHVAKISPNRLHALRQRKGWSMEKTRSQ
jgi:hypothetical protein